MATRKKAPAKKAPKAKAKAKAASAPKSKRRRKPGGTAATAKRKATARKRAERQLNRTAKRMRQQGRIPRRLAEALDHDTLDRLFPDLDDNDLYGE